MIQLNMERTEIDQRFVHIAESLKYQGLIEGSLSGFAQELGYDKSFISRVKRGQANVSLQQIASAVNHPVRMNANYLFLEKNDFQPMQIPDSPVHNEAFGNQQQNLQTGHNLGTIHYHAAGTAEELSACKQQYNQACAEISKLKFELAECHQHIASKNQEVYELQKKLIEALGGAKS